MPRLNAANNARSVLVQPVGTADTTIYVQDVSVYPSPPFRVTVDNEIMEVTAVNAGLNTLTVERAKEGTSAAEHLVGATVENRWTSGTYDELVDAGTFNSHKSRHAAGGADELTPTDIGAASQADLDAHLADKAPHSTYVPLKTTADMTLYVNASTGNDANDGSTSGTALKTIAAAINKIPQIVNHTVNINVVAGTYNEAVIIDGIAGKGVIYINGGTDLATAPNYVVGSFLCQNLACKIAITGFKLTRTGGHAIDFRSCSMFVTARYCIITELDTTYFGINASFCPAVRINNCTISNRYVAINCLESTVFSNTNDGNGNTYGLRAVEGGTIAKKSTQPSGTTNEVVTGGGVIR